MGDLTLEVGPTFADRLHELAETEAGSRARHLAAAEPYAGALDGTVPVIVSDLVPHDMAALRRGGEIVAVYRLD